MTKPCAWCGDEGLVFCIDTHLKYEDWYPMKSTHGTKFCCDCGCSKAKLLSNLVKPIDLNNSRFQRIDFERIVMEDIFFYFYEKQRGRNAILQKELDPRFR